jgi:hypothetical protein
VQHSLLYSVIAFLSHFIFDLSKSIRCKPCNDVKRNRATYVMQLPNVVGPASIKADWRLSPCALCTVIRVASLTFFLLDLAYFYSSAYFSSIVNFLTYLSDIF